MLSDAAWDDYYRPLAARLAALEGRHGAGHPALREAREEIAVRRAHSGEYAYMFFVAAR